MRREDYLGALIVFSRIFHALFGPAFLCLAAFGLKSGRAVESGLIFVAAAGSLSLVGTALHRRKPVTAAALRAASSVLLGLLFCRSLAQVDVSSLMLAAMGTVFLIAALFDLERLQKRKSTSGN